MPALTKDQFVARMKKIYTPKYVIETGNTVRVEVPERDRETVAKMIAKAHGGKISSAKKTLIEFTGFKVAIKNPIAGGGTSSKTGNIEFGLLREFQTKKVVTTPYTLNAPSPKEPDEAKFLNVVNSYINKIGKPINIKINNQVYKNICGANKVHGTPKADIVLVQLVNETSFREVTFISHKKEGGAAAFQQYGGLSSDAGTIISHDPLVLKFLADLAIFVRTETGKYESKNGMSVYRYIPNSSAGKALVARSLFGPEWRPNNYGYDSVHCIAQGVPRFTQSAGAYNLTAEAIHPPTPDWALLGKNDDFRAVFAATYREGRKFVARINNKEQTVMHMRVGIYPYAFVRNRAATEI